ncbi:MAG: hypothetical protein CMJ78_16320 [Planctomycetaceae bacterium]|nr:hypothetical protein [Planctomycetaceae bacterium]
MDRLSPDKSALTILRQCWVVGYIGVAIIVATCLVSARKHHGDQDYYHTGSQRLADGEEVYRGDEIKAFTYPPFFSLLFVPLLPFEESVRRGIWYFTNILLAGGVTYMVMMRVWPVVTGKLNWLQSSLSPPKWVFFTATALLGARFLISPIEYQGHDLVVFMCSLVAIWYWGMDRDKQTGAWAGIAAACKATPALFLPVLISQRRVVAVVSMLVAIAAATLLPDVLYPRQDNRIWGEVWFNTFVRNVGVGKAAHNEHAWVSWNLLNQSLAGTVHRLGTPIAEEDFLDHHFDVSIASLSPDAIRRCTLCLQGGVLLLLAYVTWPSHTKNMNGDELAFFRLGQGGTVLAAMLLLSPMSSKQHFCTLVAPIAFCVADYLYRRRDHFVAACLAIAFCLGGLAAKDIVGRPMGNTLLAYGSLTWCTTLILIASGRVLITRSAAFQQTLAEKMDSPPTSDETESPDVIDASLKEAA